MRFWGRKRAAWGLLTALPLLASDSAGVVKFGGLPLPGATVTASQGGKKIVAVTDADGKYSFPDLADGVWTIEVEMLCFESARKEITVAKDAPPVEWDLKLLPIEQIKSIAGAAAPPEPAVSVAPPESAKKNAPAFQRTDVKASATPPPAEPQSADFANASESELSQRASDGFLINGTANNGAASPFAQAQAFGNNRRGFRSLYTGGIGFTFDNSALDARTYSITGQDTPKPAYNNMTGMLSFGGPLKIPHLFRDGPFLALNYQWTRNRSDAVADARMPTAAERGGVFPATIVDPSNGAPFDNNIIPAARISAQARALLNFYPLPNFASAQYNYQTALVSSTHMDAVQARTNKTIGRRHQLANHADAAPVRNPRLSIQPGLDARYRLFRKSRKCFRGGGDHRQQSGPDELGSAVACVFERHRRVVRWGCVFQSPPDQRAFLFPVLVSHAAQRDLRRRLQAPGDEQSGPAERARRLHLHRRGGGQRLRRFSAGHPRYQLDCLRQRGQIFSR